MANDININESAILEALNEKIDYDGGNYKGSGLANYVVDKTGDTMTAPLTIKTTYGGHLQGVRTGVNFGDTPASQQNIGGFRCYVNDTAESNITAIVQGFIKTTSNQSSNGIQFITRKPDNSDWGYCMALETLADGKTYFTFPKCTTKATTTSTASGGNVAVIVQNYCNGTSWYRVWSDGWIEQGGVAKSNGQYVNTSVSLLKGFANANYNIVVTQRTESAMGSYINSCSACPNTTKVFYIRTGHGEKMDYNWRACGY